VNKITEKSVMKKQNYRQRCIDQKGEKCNICGNNKNIEVHHIDGDRYNNSVENLIPVCEECHNKIHTHSSSELEEWSKKVKPFKERTLSVSDEKIGEEMGQINE
jgi:5-methylcytosine-specific restriction endonuclease McrA